MRAKTAFARFLASRHQVSKKEALALISAYKSGAETLHVELMQWLGSLADLVKQASAAGTPVCSDEKRLVPIHDEVYIAELCTAIATILADSRFFIPHLAQAKYGDLQASAEGLVWVVRPFLRRKGLVRVLLTETLVQHVKTLARFGRASAPRKEDFLLAWPDGRPFSRQQIRYAARKGGYKPCSSNDFANAVTSANYSPVGAKRLAFR